ncbi:hypothetical protein [uncultured Dubosiella sp.]|uniref:hypothetical protein n=1 Tax=uncultured Dubosiella sp. TaxID=1937011 RepID=UPI0027306EEE|nr:hypothetical protein [uncultured Dubosiella sp.]
MIMDKDYLYQIDIREWIERGLDADIVVPVSGNKIDEKYDCGGAGNLKVQRNQLIHYYTVTAERYEGKCILNHTRCSIVTGKIQKMLKEKIAPDKIIGIGRIPEGYQNSLVTKVLGGAEDAEVA